VKLGNPNGARALSGKQIGNQQALAAIKANAAHRAANLRAIVDDLRIQGFTSVRAICRSTERAGHPNTAWWRVASNVCRSVDVASASRQLKRIAGRTINAPHALDPFGLKSILRSPFPQNVD